MSSYYQTKTDRMLRFIPLIILLLPVVALGQYDSSYCAQKYEESRTTESFAPTNFPEIEGGLDAVADGLSYPDTLVNKGIEGTVRIWFLVTREGEPKCFKIVKSPHQILSTVVVESLQKLSFKPAIVDNKPVERPISIPVVFKVPNK